MSSQRADVDLLANVPQDIGRQLAYINLQVWFLCVYAFWFLFDLPFGK